MRVCIDPGHGGSDPGAVARDDGVTREKDVTLAIALRLAAEAERRGWEPLLTRTQDRTLSLAARAAFANRYRADLFLSVHANAAAAPEVEGIEVYHFPGSVPGRWLALHVIDRLLERLPGHRSRGVKEANFAVLRLTRMPSILVECEFLTHPAQRRWLVDPGEQAALAGAIVDGAALASGLPYQKLLAEAPTGSRGGRGRSKAGPGANDTRQS